MLVAAFIDAYARASSRLPQLLQDWDRLDPDLRSYYLGELEEVMSDRAAVLEEARLVGAGYELASAIRDSDMAFALWTPVLWSLMGLPKREIAAHFERSSAPHQRGADTILPSDSAAIAA